jgi:hypothetical protein
MHRLRRLLVFVTLSSLCAGGVQASPDPSPDSDADVIHLRIDCDENGSPKTNCFESMSAVTTWLWGGGGSDRAVAPSAGDSVIVVIGPGEFGQFECPSGEGFVTLRGSGREQTIVADDDVGMLITHCQDLSFIDLGVRGDRIGVSWVGGGFSTWSDTDILVTGDTAAATTAAWGDTLDGGQAPNFQCGVHYFHGSRVRAIGGGTGGASLASAFYSQCGESWFFGGEILNEVTDTAAQANAVRITSGFGDVRTFGTAIRTFVNGGNPSSGEVVGVYVNVGRFHSHGSIINVDAQGATNADAIGLRVTGSGMAHTAEAAWVLTPDGSGSAVRVETATGGVAESPFLWQSGGAPPAITTQHGSDLFVETDCEATDCTGGSDPHLMIYSTSCGGGGGPWFDVVRQACRVD